MVLQSLSSTVNLQIQDTIALVIIDNPPVNALSRSVIDGLNEALDRIENEPVIKLWVVCCAGRGFIAGADLKEINRGDRNVSDEAAELLNRIARSSKPVLAAIHGNALGGGFETTLACDYRCCTEDARFGLPEVNLGAMPGYGGTQRLPRLVGYEKALDIMLTGKPIQAQEAKAIGIVDKVVTGDLISEALSFSQELLLQGARLNKVDNISIPANSDIKSHCKVALALAGQIRPGEEAPTLIVQSVQNSAMLPIDEGLKRERALSISRINAPQSIAMRNLFFAERSVAKSPQLAIYMGNSTAAINALDTEQNTDSPFAIGNRLVRPLLAQITALKEKGMEPMRLAGAFRAYGWQSEPLKTLFKIIGFTPGDTGTNKPFVEDEAQVESCVIAMYQAGLLLMAENACLQTSDLDVISCNAYGFPRFRGGIMSYGKSKQW